MTKREKKYFLLAKSVSDLSDYGRIKIGAVIVHKKEIISVGYNQRKSHPLQKHLNVYRFDEDDNCKHFLHAELSAILNSRNADLSGASIYVYRANKEGIQNCRPCEACMQAIKEKGIKTVYYTTKYGYCREELKEGEIL